MPTILKAFMIWLAVMVVFAVGYGWLLVLYRLFPEMLAGILTVGSLVGLAVALAYYAIKTG